MQQISVVIIDDHSLIRETWATFINLQANLSVVAQYSSAEEAIDQVYLSRPDVVLMDINLPGINGIEATARIIRQSPRAKVLGVSAHMQPDVVRRLMRNGASGYLSKFATSKELMQAIQSVAAGRKFICQTIKDIISRQVFDETDYKKGIESLTQREVEIIGMIRQGLISKQIAAELGLAAKTVEVHRYNILKKLGLKNSAALINFVNRHWVEQTL